MAILAARSSKRFLNPMPATMTPPRASNPFRILSEFIVLCLGALLLVLAVSGRVSLPARPIGLIAIGILFLYLAARAFARPEAGVTRSQSSVRAASLAIVGILLINIALFHTRYSMILLGIAGAVLVLRGLVSAVFAFAKK
ncbi:MAG: hypothetical protein WA823_03190 [Candidatus Acidiferrales bacterium]